MRLSRDGRVSARAGYQAPLRPRHERQARAPGARRPARSRLPRAAGSPAACTGVTRWSGIPLRPGSHLKISRRVSCGPVPMPASTASGVRVAGGEVRYRVPSPRRPGAASIAPGAIGRDARDVPRAEAVLGRGAVAPGVVVTAVVATPSPAAAGPAPALRTVEERNTAVASCHSRGARRALFTHTSRVRSGNGGCL
jgi:hypothetical protein